MVPTMQDELTAKETAKILGCSRSYLYKLIAAEKLHPIKKPTIVRQPPLVFSLREVRPLANEIYGKELTDDEIERLRKAAQGGGEA